MEVPKYKTTPSAVEEIVMVSEISEKLFNESEGKIVMLVTVLKVSKLFRAFHPRAGYKSTVPFKVIIFTRFNVQLNASVTKGRCLKCSPHLLELRLQILRNKWFTLYYSKNIFNTRCLLCSFFFLIGSLFSTRKCFCISFVLFPSFFSIANMSI